MTIFLYIAAGFVIGIAIMTVALFRQRIRSAEELHVQMSRVQVLEAQIEAERKRSNDALANLRQSHQQALDAQDEHFQEVLKRVTVEMKSAAEEMLKQRQQEFSASSSQNIGQIVTPLRDTIEAMRRAMGEAGMKNMELSSAMKEQIQLLMKQSEAARHSTDELTRVLKYGGKMQGDWGETVLCELLDSQGLTKGVHYDTQVVMRDEGGHAIKSDNGGTLRPDVILHLDNRREVIIDSKVSLTAFMDYVNARDENERQMYLKAHVESLQTHVRKLSSKDYSSYIRPPKVRMDYVIMFVPHSGALWTAFNAQPDLWRKAMEKNVFIADEQTLFAALKIVSLTWTQIAQAENHEKVYALANELMDRVGLFMKKYQTIGKALDNASKAYEEGEKKLQPSGPSILQTCAKLQKLGARQSTTNPLPQLDREMLLDDEADESRI